MVLIILGPQGSGKGTQASKLAQHFGLAKFSMGDALREVAASNTPLGKRIKPILERGDLIGLEDTKAVVREKFNQLKLEKGIIVEGIPRSMEQVKPFVEIVKQYQLEKPWLIELKISDQTASARVGKRRICSNCQYPATYRDTTCVRCGSRLIKRTDEDKKILTNRLNIYHAETEPVIAHFNQLGRHIAIDGESTIEKVYEQILRALKQRLSQA